MITFHEATPANQSLKRTESTVDEFAARVATNKMNLSMNVRAMNYKQQAARHRSLAPVRSATGR
jgi:hypothetical protein